MHTIVIATFYTDAADIERNVIVTVHSDGLRDVDIDDDLPDMPADEERQVRERATELYWAAERGAGEGTSHAAGYFIVTDNDCVLINYPYACKSLEQAQETLASLLDREPRAGYRIVVGKVTVK